MSHILFVSISLGMVGMVATQTLYFNNKQYQNKSISAASIEKEKAKSNTLEFTQRKEMERITKEHESNANKYSAFELQNEKIKEKQSERNSASATRKDKETERTTKTTALKEKVKTTNEELQALKTKYEAELKALAEAEKARLQDLKDAGDYKNKLYTSIKALLDLENAKNKKALNDYIEKMSTDLLQQLLDANAAAKEKATAPPAANISSTAITTPSTQQEQVTVDPPTTK